MFKPIRKDTLVEKVKGIFSSGVPYEDRLGTDKWANYFGHYQAQKLGNYDTDSCWALSAINCAEDQFEFLWKKGMFSQEAKDFFINNGYIDSDGDFSFSERFIEILSKNKANGGTSPQAWSLIGSYGLLPRSRLTYTDAQANAFPTVELFYADYFNPVYVTQEMKDLAIQVFNYVNIAFQTIGTNWKTPNPTLLQASIYQAPLQIGIPIPINVMNWNQAQVLYDGSTNPSHEVELYDYVVGDPFPYKIYDQYNPFLKSLSAGYYIPLVHQGIITVRQPAIVIPTAPTIQTTVVPFSWAAFWASLVAWFRSPAGTPYQGI